MTSKSNIIAVADLGFGKGDSRYKGCVLRRWTFENHTHLTIDHSHFWSQVDSLRSIHILSTSVITEVSLRGGLQLERLGEGGSTQLYSTYLL